MPENISFGRFEPDGKVVFTPLTPNHIYVIRYVESHCLFYLFCGNTEAIEVSSVFGQNCMDSGALKKYENPVMYEILADVTDEICISLGEE